MTRLLKWASTGLLLIVVVAFELAAPHTKVEESFNMQAAHDMLFTPSLADFDHLAFPGVVPRSFAGALMLSAFALPLTRGWELLRGAETVQVENAMVASHAVRLTLGAAFVLSVHFLGSAFGPPSSPSSPVLAQAGSPTRKPRRRPQSPDATLFWLNMLVAAQFHLVFYATRTLPNTFALILVTFAMGFYFRGRPYAALAVLGFTATVLRSDVLVFVAPMGVVMLARGEVGLVAGPCAGAMAVLLSLALTVPLDSYFWRRPLWPEGAVLYFNTAENKSHEWGTQPLHWYFSSALPKAFTTLTPLIPLAIVSQTRKVRWVAVAAIAFICLYSLLPHKELRFIMIVFPLLLLPIARWAPPPTCATPRRAALVVLVLALLGSTGASAIMLGASVRNYPGGDALRLVHALAHENNPSDATGPSRVYLDAFACMSGVNRFSKLRAGQVPAASGGAPFAYNKDPSLFNRTANVYTPPNITEFDFLVVRWEDLEWHRGHGFYTPVGMAETFGGITLTTQSFPPIQYVTTPFLGVLRRVRQS